MDITAVLLAAYMGILNHVEDRTSQLYVPHSLIPALLEMREKVAPIQPSKQSVFEEITRFVDGKSIEIVALESTIHQAQGESLEAMGADWVALYDLARSSDGYLVDYLPLRNIRGNDFALPIHDSSFGAVVNCRAVAESLFQHGPLSKTDFDNTLSELGTEGTKEPMVEVPSQGKKLILYGNISETLSSAGLLKMSCDRFAVCIGRSDFDRIVADLDDMKARLTVSEWLRNLIDHIRQGIESGTYQILPVDVGSATRRKGGGIDSPSVSCLLELSVIDWEDGDVVWVDDRYTNAFAHFGVAPIVDVLGILKSLFERGALDESEFFAAIIRLRKSNFRYIPITKTEILYQLGQAKISDDGLVVETHELEVIRRYVAACLVQNAPLQRPSMSPASPNPNGEVEFIQGIVRECSDAVIEIWSSADPDNCAAWNDWLFTNLYVNHLGLSKSTVFIQKHVTDEYIASLGLTWLIAGAFELTSVPVPDGTGSRRGRFLEWIDSCLLQPVIAAEPELIGVVAQSVKTYLRAIYEGLLESTSPERAIRSVQNFCLDLPDDLHNEMRLDTDFMAEFGMGVTLTIGVDDVRFILLDFYRTGAAAINGLDSAINPVDSNKQVLLKRYDLPGGGVAIQFNHPETGQIKTTAGPDIEVLVDSPTDIEAALRRHKISFDCSGEQFEEVISDVVTTLDPTKRAELVRNWMNKSVTVHYSSLYRELNENGGLTLTRALPPDFEHLINHFRLPVDLDETGEFGTALESAAENLLDEVGAEDTLKRLVTFPVALPFSVVNRIKTLPDIEKRSLVKRILRLPSSPISRIHVVRLLAELGRDEAKYARLARRQAANQLLQEGVEDTKAFISVLSWVSEQFGNWPQVHKYDSRLRLAMEWAHAHRLYSALIGARAPADWINDHFAAWRRHLVTRDAIRNQGYLLDIAHPRQLTAKTFLVSGLAYAVGDSQACITDQLIKLVVDASSLEVQGQTIQSPEMLHDPTLAGNSLSSFLGIDRGKALTPFIGAGLGRSFNRSSCRRSVFGAIEMIESGSDVEIGFGVVGAIVGNLRPYRGTNGRLTILAAAVNYVNLLITSPDYGRIAFQFAVGLVSNNKSERLRKRLKTELVAIGKYFASRQQIESLEADALLLLDWAFRLSVLGKRKRFAEFSALTIELTEAWPAFATPIRPTFARLCSELPPQDASELWPALLRLRAEH